MDDLIRRLNEAGARYAVIGGQAMRLHGMPRFSMDWDLLIPPRDLANLELLNRVLGSEVDMPIVALGPLGENLVQTYQTSQGVIQFHLGVPGLLSYEEVEQETVELRTETGTSVRCLWRNAFLRSKLAANRQRDQDDIVFLQERKKADDLR